ncbi:disease resistance protein RUN1-like [Ziziphus jujuba]|uniref:Disease resistance protein RUN1-like n=1 Tax=Ziziphus jujuba TaxID=326968 RepID=A0ABM3ZXI2_ZIZJJ|nr:disease resistance protein RUN1-like [Ziziphus jujuba]
MKLFNSCIREPLTKTELFQTRATVDEWSNILVELKKHPDDELFHRALQGTQAVEGIFLSLPKYEELHMSEEKKMLEMGKLSLDKLIVLDLGNCEYLVETFDFSRAPNLERLNLEGCKRLSVVHPTIKELKGLKLLNLKDCESLDSLPQIIYYNFLEIFILSGCKKLDRFLDIVGDMNCLIQLFLEGTAIKQLSTSVECLTNLKLLDLRECKNLLSLPDFICSLTSLKGLTIGGCSMINKLAENIRSLEKLEELHACRTAVRKAPSSIVLLKNLRKLCFFRYTGVASQKSKSNKKNNVLYYHSAVWYNS